MRKLCLFLGISLLGKDKDFLKEYTLYTHWGVSWSLLHGVTYIRASLATDEASLAVDALPRLDVDLVRQLLRVVEAGGVDRGAAVLAADQLLVLQVALVAVLAVLALVVRLQVDGLQLARLGPLLASRSPPVRLGLLQRTLRAASSALLTTPGRRDVVSRVEDLPGSLNREKS